MTSEGWFFLGKGSRRLGLVLIHKIFGYDPCVKTVARGLSTEGFTEAAVGMLRGKKATP